MNIDDDAQINKHSTASTSGLSARVRETAVTFITERGVNKINDARTLLETARRCPVNLLNKHE